MPPPSIETGFIDLPQCRLHYAQAGSGPPLIMVPATISELDNWLGLVQFIAQKFSVYFFELPGHGQSTPLAQGFSTDKVVTLIADLTKKLELKKFSLMGFSFGGILALKTLVQLNDSIEKIILLSPVVSSKTIQFSRFRKELLIILSRALRKKSIRSMMLKTAHNHLLVNGLIKLLTRLGRVETAGPRYDGLKHKLLALPSSTLEVLAAEINEILHFELAGHNQFTQPCYFGMSVNDPLLDYSQTAAWMNHRFTNLTTHEFTFPYHQPPQPLPFSELVNHYQPFLGKIQ